MKEPTTCVMIADGARAKFLTKNTNALLPILPTQHAEDTVTTHLEHKHPSHGRVGIKALHSYYEHADWSYFKKEAFAIEIARVLYNLVKTYDRLILIAAPVVLGCLRQHLSPHVASKITLEIDKDLTKIPLKKVMGYIQLP